MKKINSLSLILIISIFAFCQNVQNDNKKVNRVKEVKIKLIDFSLMTFISVDCDKYEEYFKNYKVISITDSIEIQQFLQQMIKLEPIDSTYSKSVDTRAKIELITDLDTNIICVGSLSLYKDKNVYKTPQGVIDCIEKLELKHL